MRKIHEALALGRDLSHPFSLAFALTYAAVLYYFRREGKPTQEWAEATIALASEQGFPFWLAMGTMLRGWALAEQGRGKRALRNCARACRRGGPWERNYTPALAIRG